MGRTTNILLILDRCGPGEAIRASPMLGAVRAAHPAARISLLVGEQAYPLFAEDRRFDKVTCSTLYGRRPRSLPRLRALLTACELIVRLGLNYDLVITFLWGSSWLNAISRLVGRGARIGYAHRFPGFLTSSLRAYGSHGDIHANLRLLEAAGVPPPDERSPALVVDGEAAAAASRLLGDRGWRAGHRLVVMHSGSDWACQQWLPERWADLADRVIDQHDADVVFTGLASDTAYVEQIRSRMTSPSVSMAGETSLSQLAAVMSLASFCVTVDSVGHDMAQALGVPTTVLAGPTRPEAPAGRRLRLVNRTPDELQRTILDCQGRFPLGFCHDYSCPWAGLQHISVDMAAREIAL